jgi:hypothetical protein
MIIAALVIECDVLFIAWLALRRQVQEAIRRIVPAGLSILATAQPPCRAIRCCPTLLVSVMRVHGIGRASTATIGWASDVDDPVWIPKRPGGA